jgi:uncharacterized membrane protein YfcA
MAESEAAAAPLGGRGVAVMALIGLVAGFLSSFFGIGGGTVIVPALVLIGFTQRRAVATSLAAIVPTAIAAAITYLIHGHVHWVVAGLLIAGIIAGARIGSMLLSRLPEKALRWAFFAFLLFMASTQFIFVPERDAAVPVDWARGAAVLGLGLVTGILSGILGVGGGIVVVPALTILFGASDLVARGTSLVMMIPGSATGTFANVRKKLVDLRAAALIGLPAIAMTPVGNWCARLFEPRVNTVLFGVYIVGLAIRSLYVAWKKK